jgi:hypothetical protein
LLLNRTVNINTKGTPTKNTLINVQKENGVLKNC